MKKGIRFKLIVAIFGFALLMVSSMAEATKISPKPPSGPFGRGPSKPRQFEAPKPKQTPADPAVRTADTEIATDVAGKPAEPEGKAEEPGELGSLLDDPEGGETSILGSVEQPEQSVSLREVVQEGTEQAAVGDLERLLDEELEQQGPVRRPPRKKRDVPIDDELVLPNVSTVKHLEDSRLFLVVRDVSNSVNEPKNRSPKVRDDIADGLHVSWHTLARLDRSLEPTTAVTTYENNFDVGLIDFGDEVYNGLETLPGVDEGVEFINLETLDSLKRGTREVEIDDGDLGSIEVGTWVAPRGENENTNMILAWSEVRDAVERWKEANPGPRLIVVAMITDGLFNVAEDGTTNYGVNDVGSPKDMIAEFARERTEAGDQVVVAVFHITTERGGGVEFPTRAEIAEIRVPGARAMWGLSTQVEGEFAEDMGVSDGSHLMIFNADGRSVAEAFQNLSQASSRVAE